MAKLFCGVASVAAVSLCLFCPTCFVGGGRGLAGDRGGGRNTGSISDRSLFFHVSFRSVRGVSCCCIAGGAYSCRPLFRRFVVCRAEGSEERLAGGADGRVCAEKGGGCGAVAEGYRSGACRGVPAGVRPAATVSETQRARDRCRFGLGCRWKFREIAYIYRCIAAGIPIAFRVGDGRDG